MCYMDQQWDKALGLWEEYFNSEQHDSVSGYLCVYFANILDAYTSAHSCLSSWVICKKGKCFLNRTVMQLNSRAFYNSLNL